MNGAAGLLAASVLADSAVEHYRGSFENRAMYVPLAMATLNVLVSGHGIGDRRSGAHALRGASYVLGAITGLIGAGFHIYNVTKRPGGLSWINLFYGAPIGAPIALLLSGVMGMAAERARGGPEVLRNTANLSLGRVTAGAAAAGLLGTVGEAGLLHFRGAYHNPAMFLPVTVPPVAATLLGNAAYCGAGKDRWLTRWWLRLTAALGIVGTGFHLFGVARNMGGWGNWSQNVLNGPPIPAPPSFTGLALAGLAALRLLERRADG
ncbi:MAG TPA: hypothetical protein VFL55_02080 [Acetobacteraceae bacterium]|nr:hypothetical protein [Acetobacteraceae bacterium]